MVGNYCLKEQYRVKNIKDNKFLLQIMSVREIAYKQKRKYLDGVFWIRIEEKRTTFLNR